MVVVAEAGWQGTMLLLLTVKMAGNNPAPSQYSVPGGIILIQK
jgi:hypothetical protein